METITRKETTDHMEYHENGGVPYLSFPKLSALDGIVHGFSTRLGGVSEGHLSSMNLSFSRGDTREHVLENFSRMSERLGFPMENLVFSMQTHTTNVRRVGKADCGRGILRPLGYEDVDGLITDTPGLVLATFFAD